MYASTERSSMYLLKHTGALLVLQLGLLARLGLQTPATCVLLLCLLGGAGRRGAARRTTALQNPWGGWTDGLRLPRWRLARAHGYAIVHVALLRKLLGHIARIDLAALNATICYGKVACRILAYSRVCAKRRDADNSCAGSVVPLWPHFAEVPINGRWHRKSALVHLLRHGFDATSPQTRPIRRPAANARVRNARRNREGAAHAYLPFGSARVSAKDLQQTSPRQQRTILGTPHPSGECCEERSPQRSGQVPTVKTS